MTTAITENTTVLAGTTRQGQYTLYYSDQLSELSDTATANGNRAVLGQLTDEILVLQIYTEDYSELLSEQEYFIVGSVAEATASILRLEVQ